MSFVRPLAVLLLTLVLTATTATSPATAESIETAARQAILMDFDTGAVLLEKNADDLMPPSSMSKLMTVYMVFERLKEGRLSLDDKFPVSEKAWRKQGSKMFVMVGDKVRVEDLLRGVIIQSGNDACIVLAEGISGSEEAFADEMTRRSREIGLTRSVFKNSTGWPDDGHLMTARDLAVLAKRLILDFPEQYPLFAEKNFTWHGISQGNRNPLLYKNIGADGLKTGHTEAAGYGLTASAKRDGRRLILVVNGLQSVNQRSEETERLLEWGFRSFNNYALFKKGETVTEADVWLGSAAKVPLVTPSDLVVTLPVKARRDMKVAAVFDGPLPAPIRKGDLIAKLVVTVPGEKPVEMPLLAGADVEKLGFLGRIGAALKYLVWGAG